MWGPFPPFLFVSWRVQGRIHDFHGGGGGGGAQKIMYAHVTGVNPGGGGWGVYPPTFLGGGMACTNIPPLFEHKITLNLTFIVKKMTFLTVKLLKTPKIARSLHSLAHKCTLRLNLAVLPVHVFFSWHHLCKERCRKKQTLCNIMARKSIAGLPIIQVKGTWRSQGGIINSRAKITNELRVKFPIEILYM